MGVGPSFWDSPQSRCVCVCVWASWSLYAGLGERSSGSEERPLPGTPVSWLQQTDPRYCWKKKTSEEEKHFRLLQLLSDKKKGQRGWERDRGVIFLVSCLVVHKAWLLRRHPSKSWKVSLPLSVSTYRPRHCTVHCTFDSKASFRHWPGEDFKIELTLIMQLVEDGANASILGGLWWIRGECWNKGIEFWRAGCVCCVGALKNTFLTSWGFANFSSS